MTLLLDDDECEMMSPATKAPCTESNDNAPVFHRNGGNGLVKMEALAYGTPMVKVADGVGRAAKRPRPSAATPTASEASAGSQSHTQPKLLSGASSVDGTPRTASPNLSDTVPHHTGRSTQSETVTPITNTPVSETAHKTNKAVDNVSRTLNMDDASEVPAPTSKIAAPPKQQMKLSDFFSKMACKRPATS